MGLGVIKSKEEGEHPINGGLCGNEALIEVKKRLLITVREKDLVYKRNEEEYAEGHKVLRIEDASEN